MDEVKLTFECRNTLITLAGPDEDEDYVDSGACGHLIGEMIRLIAARRCARECQMVAGAIEALDDVIVSGASPAIEAASALMARAADDLMRAWDANDETIRDRAIGIREGSARHE